MSNKDTLPYYPVVRGLFNAAAPEPTPGHCPICGKDGAWDGERFVPANERQAHYPRCYCATMHRTGATSHPPSRPPDPPRP